MDVCTQVLQYRYSHTYRYTHRYTYRYTHRYSQVRPVRAGYKLMRPPPLHALLWWYCPLSSGSSHALGLVPTLPLAAIVSAPPTGTGTCLCLFSCRRPLQLLFHNASPPRELHHCTLFPLPRNLISPLLGLCLCLCDCVPPKPPAAVFRPAFRTLHAVPDLPISRIARPTALPGCDSPFVLEPFSLHFAFTCSTGRLHFLAAAEFSIDHVASSLPLIEFVFFS